MSDEAPPAVPTAESDNTKDQGPAKQSDAGTALQGSSGHEGSAGGGPTATAPGPTPAFVAPLSYLRPLSRAPQQPATGLGSSGSGSRPQTRESLMTPLDREQIEGLVSDGFFFLWAFGGSSRGSSRQ